MLERLRIGAFAVLLAIAVIGMSGMAAGAQEATPAADGSPMAAECVSPGLPPGTPTPMDDGAASPEAMEGMDMASPEAGASPEAMGSPEAIPAPEVPEGQPADEATAAAVDAALTNYIACLNEGQATSDPSLYVALESPNFIMGMTETGNPYDRVASEMEEGGPGTVQLLGISDQMVYDDGRVSGDASVVIGDHWAATIRVLLVQEGDTWLYDEEHFLPADTSDAASISVVGIAVTETTDESTGEKTYEFTFTGGSTTITQAEALTFTIDNTTAVEVHEAIVLQLPEGADPMGLLDESISFEDVEFIGAVAPIFPGQVAELTLVNLEPGVYTMVCFFPGPDGTPHAFNGMIAQFEVVAPAA